MTRLQSELRRLYLPQATADTGADAANLFDTRGATRALVLELAGSVGREAIDRVWRGVQSDLELPAPGVAVNGSDGFQLWFSLEAPVCTPDARAFLEGLRRRFLAEVPADRVRLMPASTGPGGPVHARLVPAEQAHPGQWSAFVAPDLAALFVDTPWLDVAPSIDGQADLLRSLDSIDPSAFEAVSARLGQSVPRANARAPGTVGDGTASEEARTARPTMPADPAGFLLQVMRDDTVPLALRIEAAKALLAHGDGRGAR